MARFKTGIGVISSLLYIIDTDIEVAYNSVDIKNLWYLIENKQLDNIKDFSFDDLLKLRDKQGRYPHNQRAFFGLIKEAIAEELKKCM